jgi:PPOX class probable F420-dependent enzyme
MPKMSREEMKRFITEGTRTGHLATVREDGRPHVAPIWFVMDGGDIVFTSWHDSVKGRNLLRTGYASLSVDEPSPDYSFVVLEGPVTVDRDPAASRFWATENGRRYMGEDRASEFGARNGIDGEWVFRLTPVHWTGIRDIAGS